MHVIRWTDAFKTVLEIATKSGRCHVTIESIQEQFQRLAQEIENLSAAFILNADKSAFQDFVDSREIQVVVPLRFRTIQSHSEQSIGETRDHACSDIC
jgi:hypothetical protein